MLSAKAAILLELQLVRRGPFILGGRVIPPFAFCAGQVQNIPHLHNPM
jgi:hypothetical protein